jgi:hypothetical protein
MTSYQLAQRSGMPQSTVHRLLHNAENLPLHNVEMLLDVVGVRVRLVPQGKAKS